MPTKIYVSEGFINAISAKIPCGEENAVHMDVLAERTGVSCRRLRQIINAARMSGAEIAASERGYFVPSGESERLRWLHRCTARGRTAFHVSEASRQKIPKQQFEGQLALDELDSLKC